MIVAAGGAIILIGTAGCGFYGLTHNSSNINTNTNLNHYSPKSRSSGTALYDA